MRQKKRHWITRRRLIGSGAGLLLAGTAVGAYLSEGTPIRKDRKAKSEAEIYARGLVPIEKSGWTQPEGVAAPWPKLTQTLDTGVLVVGAGLAGSSLALHLAEVGVATVVLEARQPGWGASGRNAGHVLPILKDMSVFESFPDKGKAFIEAFREHHTIPFDLSEKHGIDCDAERAGYLNVMTSKDAFTKFEAESAYLEEQGFQKLTRLGGSEMKAATGTDYYPYGLVYENGGRVNPYLLTNGMCRVAADMGARIFGDSEALSIRKTNNGWRVKTAEGEVQAKTVVFCTAAYPTDIVPQFETCFYPLGAYALTTKVLPKEAQELIMPGGATMAQVPVDLHPLVKDRHGRLILSSLPTTMNASNSERHFQDQLNWLHKIWPETRGMKIELDDYWTGRVAMRTREFPGTYQLDKGLLGLMHFNAWGNVMAPLMGKLLAEALAADRLDQLYFPLEKPKPLSFRKQQDILYRNILIPAARFGQKVGMI